MIVSMTSTLKTEEAGDSISPGSPEGNDGDPTGCVPNISKQERRKRLAFGVLAFAVSLIILVVLLAIGADRWWRLVLFLMFLGATVGFFQWRDKT